MSMVALKTSAVFPVFRELDVGGKSKDEMLADLKVWGFHIKDQAMEMMYHAAWKVGEKERVAFIRAKVRDLGFDEPPKLHELWGRIKDMGHQLCEPADGPAIPPCPQATGKS